MNEDALPSPYSPRAHGEPTRQAILAAFAEAEARHVHPTVREVADAIGKSPTAVARQITYLIAAGELERFGKARGARGVRLARKDA